MGLAILIVGTSPEAAFAADCSPLELRDGSCNVSGGLGDGSAILNGNSNSPGSGGGSGGGTGESESADPLAGCDVLAADGTCFVSVTSILPAQPITLADIAAFRPDVPVDNMEPNGWMIVGLDTNFFATGGGGVKDGVLLGQPASVRFTPVSWNWTYGDGSGASLGSPGARWAAQGIAEFDPTPTSHIYRVPGSYVINLTVNYRAEYRFAAQPWTTIEGTLPVPANPLTASAGDAKTVLVERECRANPAGPGC